MPIDSYNLKKLGLEGMVYTESDTNHPIGDLGGYRQEKQDTVPPAIMIMNKDGLTTVVVPLTDTDVTFLVAKKQAKAERK